MQTPFTPVWCFRPQGVCLHSGLRRMARCREAENNFYFHVAHRPQADFSPAKVRKNGMAKVTHVEMYQVLRKRELTITTKIRTVWSAFFLRGP